MEERERWYSFILSWTPHIDRMYVKFNADHNIFCLIYKTIAVKRLNDSTKLGIKVFTEVFPVMLVFVRGLRRLYRFVCLRSTRNVERLCTIKTSYVVLRDFAVLL
jgi:hypothetical protein